MSSLTLLVLTTLLTCFHHTSTSYSFSLGSLLTAPTAQETNAPHALRELVLDDFMEGFLFKLCLQKWQRFAKYVLYWTCLVQVVSSEW